MEPLSQLTALHQDQVGSLPESFRLRRALQAPEFDQRQLSSMMESFSRLAAPRRNQLSSLPEGS